MLCEKQFWYPAELAVLYKKKNRTTSFNELVTIAPPHCDKNNLKKELETVRQQTWSDDNKFAFKVALKKNHYKNAYTWNLQMNPRWA